jgi:hypothetical protein
MTLDDEFDAIDLTTLRQQIETGQEEHLTLDFKRAVSSDLGSKDDQRHFAEALAGFANADGGLIIWGIGTSRKGGVDIATSEQPIGDVTRFVGRLNELTGNLANPRVEGVRHKKIVSTGTSGFAVSLIPPSDSGPHMAKAGVNRYLRRHGDSFLPMEHYEVADMFGRRPRAKITVERHILRAGLRTSDRVIEVLLKLRNVGRSPALAPFLTIDTDEYTTVSLRGLTRATAHEDGVMRMVPMTDGVAVFVASRGLMLPTGLAFDAAVVSLIFPLRTHSARRIICRVAAENAPIEEIVLEIPEGEVERLLPKRS